MSKINWQAYLDGSLSAELREEAERILASDPHQRAQLENLKQFVAEIRRQGLTQEVPLARLHKSIPSHRRPFSWPRVAIPSLVGVAAVAFALFMFNSNEVGADGLAVRTVEDYSVATQWMKQGTGLPLRPLSLTTARIVGAEYGKHTGCYCMKMPNGEFIHLSFTDDKEAMKQMKRVTVDGRTYLEGKDCIGFEACGLLWMTHGASDDCRRRLAAEAAAQLQS